MTLAHTPYAGRARPFSIGLRPIAPEHWITPDGLLTDELALKRDLLAHRHDIVVRARPDTWAAQGELLDLVAAHLIGHHPDRYRRSGHVIGIRPDVASIRLDDPHEPPIVTAARLVQDDLVLMRKGDDGWRLVAACLCFPSNWSLAEKFDQPMEAIHAPVPGFAGQMATRVNRIFDNLPRGEIVERFNWSVHDDAALHHPPGTANHEPWSRGDLSAPVHAFVRVERQTLRRLPLSGDIIFTIRIHVDPITAFTGHPDGARLAKALHDQLAALNEAELSYKNLLAGRDGLLAALARQFSA